MKADYLIQRNGFWQYHRRVPKAFVGLVGKSKFVVISTKIAVADDRTGAKAARVAARINEQQEAHWRGLASGTPGKERWRDAVTIARAHGLDYLSPDEAARRDIGELLTRIETLRAGDRRTDVAIVDAVLGGVEKPRVMLSDLIKEYEAASKTDMAAMSPNQLRKWRNAKKAAADKFIEVRGDKAIADLRRVDFTGYADHWEARVISGEINAGTANKSVSHVTGMVRAVNKRLRLGIDPSIFTETRIAGGRDGKRATFTVDNIKRILASLNGLNDDAADILRVCVETGCRPNEIANLNNSRIMLDAAVPYIEIAADGRKTKTESSKRTIPLVGVALEAMKRHGAGFARYRDKGDNLSATLMKHLRSRDLLPTDKHTVYSLRHAFKDRLRAIECPEELTDALMGHSDPKPNYGMGYTLDAKLKYLQAIAMAGH